MMLYVPLALLFIGLVDLHAFTIITPTIQSNPASLTGTSGGTITTNINPGTSIPQTSVSSFSVGNLDLNIPTLYNDSTFPTIQLQIKNLNSSMSQLLNQYSLASKNMSHVIWAIKAPISGSAVSQSGGSSSALSSQPLIDYVSTFSLFQSYIAGSQQPSYLSTYQQFFGIYFGLYPKFSAYVTRSGETVSPTALNCFTIAPFQTGAPTMSLLQTIVDSLNNYMNARCSLITPNHYLDNNGGADLFGVTGLFQYCDNVVTTLQNYTTNQFKAVSALQGISSTQVATLQNTYGTIFNNYIKNKGVLIVQTVITLLQNIAKQSSANNVGNGLASSVVNVMVLENYITLFNAAVAFLQQETPSFDVTTLGSYKTFSDVQNAAYLSMELIYAFNFKVVMNSIEQTVLSSLGTSNGSTVPYQNLNVQNIIQALGIMQGMITKAAAYAVLINDANGNQIYTNQANQVQIVIASLQTGIQAQSVNSYQNALIAYYAALQAAQQLQFINFSAYLTTIIDQINLQYEASLMNLYVTNSSYLTALNTYITNAQTTSVTSYEADQALWWSIFYPTAVPSGVASTQTSSTTNSFLQGFYTLANASTQTLASVISSIQQNQFSVPTQQNLQIYNAYEVLSNLTNGLSEMLVQGALFPDKQPADNNMYINYYTPNGYHEAYIQYQTILQIFDQLDVSIAQYGNSKPTPYAPLSQLLTGQKTINSFGK